MTPKIRSRFSGNGLIIALALAPVLCSAQKPVRPIYDTLGKLTEFKTDTAYLKFNDKKYYKFKRYPSRLITFSERKKTAVVTPHMPAVSEKAVAGAGGSFYPGATSCSGDEYAGTDRAQAKTHLVQGASHVFATLDDLFGSGLLVDDTTMRSHVPAISESATSPRVAEEKKNVRITKVYICGIYRENDNDFHMIIGNGMTGSARKLLNVEVSGLPASGTALDAVRQQIKEKFGDITCGSGAYKPLGQLIPITIEGSIFFDIDHPSGKVGFPNYKPTTSWEIHPIKKIVFLDD